MRPEWIWMLATAFSSSVFTLVLAYLLYRLWGEKRLDAELLAMQEEFEQRVKSGVLAAGEELLPAFREQVALGFTDALKASHTAGLMEDTAKRVAAGTGLLEKSFGNLFGVKPRSK